MPEIFLSHPNVTQAGSQLILPHFTGSKAFLLLALALIGTDITPFTQFYLAVAVADKGRWPGRLQQGAGGRLGR